mmetsp:Transcript_42441/g.67268  ORF Transcript_42441/g.67268 Transcript_42441/m.67268 type:complete len:270 (+) Transcript_42441:306-1115(+)
MLQELGRLCRLRWCEGIRRQFSVAHPDCRHIGRVFCRRLSSSNVDCERQWHVPPFSQAECEFHGQAAAHGETQQYIGAAAQVSHDLVDQGLQHGTVSRIIFRHDLFSSRSSARQLNCHHFHGLILPGREDQRGATGEGQTIGPQSQLHLPLVSIPDKHATTGAGCYLTGDIGRRCWILGGVHIDAAFRVHPEARLFEGVDRQSCERREPGVAQDLGVELVPVDVATCLPKFSQSTQEGLHVVGLGRLGMTHGLQEVWLPAFRRFDTLGG